MYQAIANNIRILVSFSTGASSAVAVERILQAWGAERTEIVFCDTLVEHKDNYRFMDDCQKRWQTLYDAKPITKLVEGRTPLQVAHDEHIIPNQKIAPCTKRLKIIPFQNHIKTFQEKGYFVLVALGLAWHERHRMEAPRKNYGAMGAGVLYPLMDNPIAAEPKAIVKSWGIELPVMYPAGFPHANCGGGDNENGAGCIKMGKGDWRRFLAFNPDSYHATERWEEEHKKDPVLSGYAILRDTRGGIMQPMTLKELRIETESATAKQMNMFALLDDLNGCSVECGAAS